VLGHEHVAVHTEIELLSSLFQDIQKCLFDAVIVEQGASLIATACYEVRASDVVTPLKTSWHSSKIVRSRREVGDVEHKWECLVLVSPITPQKSGCPILLRSKRVGSKRLREPRVGRLLNPTLFQKREKDGAPTFKVVRDERVRHLWFIKTLYLEDRLG